MQRLVHNLNKRNKMLHFTIKLNKVRKAYPKIQFNVEHNGILNLSAHSLPFSEEKLFKVFEAIKADNKDILITKYRVNSITWDRWDVRLLLEIDAFFEEETPKENSGSSQTK